jgi:hypothetical protein
MCVMWRCRVERACMSPTQIAPTTTPTLSALHRMKYTPTSPHTAIIPRTNRPQSPVRSDPATATHVEKRATSIGFAYVTAPAAPGCTCRLDAHLRFEEWEMELARTSPTAPRASMTQDVTMCRCVMSVRSSRAGIYSSISTLVGQASFPSRCSGFAF